MRPSQIRFAALFVLAVAPATALLAADGDLDPTFSDDGQLTRAYPLDQPVADVRLAVEPGGGLLTSSRLSSSTVGLVRYEANGDVDSAFGALGSRVLTLRTQSATWDDLPGIHILASGHFLVVGSESGEQTFAPRVARLTAGGDLDTTFGGDGYVDVPGLPGTPAPERNYEVLASALDSQGRILVAGSCNLCPANVDRDAWVLRLLADGTPDPGFGAGGWAIFDPTGGEDDAVELEVDASDRVLVRGWGTVPGTQPYVARLAVNGALDGGWGAGGVSLLSPTDIGYSPEAMAWDPATGGVVLAHSAATVNGRPTGLARVTGAGLYDPDFGDAGFVDLSIYDEGTYLYDVKLQSDGKIVAVGRIDGNGAQLGGFFLARTLADGTLDTTFDGNGVKRVEFDRTTNAFDEGYVAAFSGGRLVAAGRSTAILPEDHFALLRTTSDLIFMDGFGRGTTGAWAIAP
ncbi:MAG: hypothetical protein QG573_822 [Acidobacteriota bacterium]|nr:hypothetical protein [Acidobacteriota bacterium]